MKDPFNQCDVLSDDEPQLTPSPKYFQNIKFFKELNFMQNQKLFRQKKIRQRRISNSINFIIQANQKKQNKNVVLQKDGKKQILVNGHIIRNSFRKKKIDGSTQIYFQNGIVFKGNLKEGIYKTGFFDFGNGYSYSGQLNGKKFYGQGTLICPDGKKFSGIWNGDTINEKTYIQYPNGDIYYGSTQKLKKHGEGFMFFQNGAKYSGQFKEGKITGYGSYFSKQGIQTKGLWEDRKLIEQGSFIEDTLDFIKSKQNLGYILIQDNIKQKVSHQKSSFQKESNSDKNSDQIKQFSLKSAQLRSDSDLNSDFVQLDEVNIDLSFLSSKIENSKVTFSEQ